MLITYFISADRINHLNVYRCQHLSRGSFNVCTQKRWILSDQPTQHMPTCLTLQNITALCLYSQPEHFLVNCPELKVTHLIIIFTQMSLASVSWPHVNFTLSYFWPHLNHTDTPLSLLSREARMEHEACVPFKLPVRNHNTECFVVQKGNRRAPSFRVLSRTLERE